MEFDPGQRRPRLLAVLRRYLVLSRRGLEPDTFAVYAGPRGKQEAHRTARRRARLRAIRRGAVISALLVTAGLATIGTRQMSAWPTLTTLCVLVALGAAAVSLYQFAVLHHSANDLFASRRRLRFVSQRQETLTGQIAALRAEIAELPNGE